MRLFVLPGLTTVAAFFVAYAVGGWAMFAATLILIALEVTLSFDNAVVNARILKGMTPLWQRRFLTWGMLFSVVGTRLVLPIFIVSAVAFMTPWAVAELALFNPESYAALIHEAHYAIGGFGGVFLLLVACKYFMDDAKELHWIHFIERHMVRWGSIEAAEIALTLFFLLVVSFFAISHQGIILASGITGLILFVLVEGSTAALRATSRKVAEAGLGAFLYLNALDSAFSLDGVVGAFAVTSNVLTIVLGLGVGAYFVRTLTIYMVRHNTLHHLPYLEHGAHWAIFGLAGAMLLGLVVHLPEVVTGGIGVLFIVSAYLTSLHEGAKEHRHEHW